VAIAFHAAFPDPRGNQAEAEQARAGKDAGIIAKMNALLEPEIISALYEASMAGRAVDLIIRGVCALRPGIGRPLLTTIRVTFGHRSFFSNITACSTSRARTVCLLSSADWMDIFFRRVEVCFPVLDEKTQGSVWSTSP